MAVDTWNQVFGKLNRVVPIIVKVATEEIKLLLKDNLENLWYERKINHEYRRTSELLESVTASKVFRKGRYESVAQVFFDDSKVSHIKNPNEKWGQHASSIDGNPFDISIIASYLNYGEVTPLYTFDGVNFVKATMEQLSEIDYRINKKLKAMGYQVEAIFR